MPMWNVDVIETLEERFLGQFREYAAQLEVDFIQVRARAHSLSVGSSTPFQGHVICLECFFPEASRQEADTVAICIGVKHLTTEPMLCDSSVVWGDPRGIELELLEDPVPFTSEAIQAIEEAAPTLFEALRMAVARRCEPRTSFRL